jgi:8-oxo-dGTP pyrophosphatase MutT (NUDIX family)
MADEPSWAKGREKPPAWRSGPGRSRFANPWIELVEYDAVAPTGFETHYAVVRFRKLAVGVLPLCPDGTVVLVGQQRFANPGYSWEMPEGGAEPEEDPVAGAQRELREEAGLTAASWREVLRMELSNSVTDEQAVCFLAWDLAACETAPDETEHLDLARVPFRALLEAAGAGLVRDSLTVATAFRAYHMAREGELPRHASSPCGTPTVYLV